MLDVDNLTVEFGDSRVLDGVSLSVQKGRILGIVGESGSGKTMTALSIMGLLSEGAKVVSGRITLDGRELTAMTERELADVRGNDIAMIFQEPMTSLNPTMRIGSQLTETLIIHNMCQKKGIGRKKQLNSIAERALLEAGLSNPEYLCRRYPHELSGGMRQRVMIAMGIICRPDYLLCDEPTTALDVTTEKGIIQLIKRLQREHDMGVIFITHDLKLLRGFADEVAVMNAGRVVERGTPEQIFEHPSEEYTRKLIAAIPDRNKRIERIVI